MENLHISGDPVTKLTTIGEGNFSQVFLAESKYGKIAAVKKVKKSVKDKTAYELAKRQAFILKNLHSPYVLELFDTFEEHNYFYLIEKYCKGKTLQSILKVRKGFSPNEAQKIFKNILKGVEFLISKNIIHRDLKPSNIIIKDNNEAYIVDFGFACKFQPDDENIIKERFGTPYYMSPELLSKKLYNSKSDIWSLGVIYYELLYGYLPYQAQTDTELLKQISDPKNDIFKSKKYVPDHIKALIKRCLTIDVNKRIEWSQLFSSGLSMSCSRMSQSQMTGHEIIYQQTSICIDCCRF